MFAHGERRMEPFDVLGTVFAGGCARVRSSRILALISTQRPPDVFTSTVTSIFPYIDRMTFSTFTQRLSILSLALLLFGTVPALAQIDIKPGIRAGVNFANAGGDDVPDSVEGRTAFHVGAQVLIDPAGPLAVQPELLFTQKGFEQSATFGGQTFTGTQRVSYLQLNGLAKFQIPVAGPVSPNLFVGPGIAIELSESFEFDGESEDTENFKGTDFSAVVGGGVDIEAGFGTVLFDVRYDLGLTNVPDTDDDVSAKNRTLGISVGLLF